MAQSFRSIFPEGHGIDSPMLGLPSLVVYPQDVRKTKRKMGQRIPGRKGRPHSGTPYWAATSTALLRWLPTPTAMGN